MKSYFIIAVAALLFSSCLKQSIPDAMLADELTASGGTATMRFEVNGKLATVSIENRDQYTGNYSLGCKKFTSTYGISGSNDFGNIYFDFLTDSLTTKEYRYSGTDGDFRVMMYINNNLMEYEFIHAPSDYLSFTITSYHNGYISGTFSGQLSPLISEADYSHGILPVYGTPGSIKITNGTFQNVPVYY